MAANQNDTFPEQIKKNMIVIDPNSPLPIERLINDQELTSERFKVLTECIESLEYTSNVKAEAYFQIAQFHLKGLAGVVLKNTKLAIQYLNKAIQQGNRVARIRLGRLYLDGSEGVTQDVGSTISLWEITWGNTRIAAEVNYGLGLIYKQGNNKRNAFHFFSAAHDAGFPDASFEMALAYKEGMFVQIMMDEYHKHMKIAVDRDSMKAQYYVASEKKKTGEPDFHNHLKRAADAGHREAQFEFAEYLEAKVDPEKQAKELFEIEKYYQKASDQGHGIATFRLAMLRKRNGGSHVDLLLLAKSLNDRDRLGIELDIDFELGKMHLVGCGVQENLQMGIDMIDACARRGHVNARAYLTQIYDKTYAKRTILDSVLGSVTQFVGWSAKSNTGANGGAAAGAVAPAAAAGVGAGAGAVVSTGVNSKVKA